MEKKKEENMALAPFFLALRLVSIFVNFFSVSLCLTRPIFAYLSVSSRLEKKKEEEKKKEKPKREY